MKNETEQTHPLKVYYPYGGKHFMLRWEEHSVGQQLVLAKSKNAIFNTAKSIIKKYPYSNFDKREVWIEYTD